MTYAYLQSFEVGLENIIKSQIEMRRFDVWQDGCKISILRETQFTRERKHVCKAAILNNDCNTADIAAHTGR